MTTFNRVLWIVIGALLTAAGVVGVLANLGHMPGLDKNRDLITEGMDAQWRSWGAWAWGVTIAVGILLAVLGALLLRAQFLRRGGPLMANLTRTSAVSPPDSDQPVQELGRTRVATSTLNEALARDLQGDEHVRRAAVRLTGEPSSPDLRMRLAVTADADIDQLRHHVNRAVTRFATTSGLRPNLAEVVIRMSSAERERVH